MSSSVFEVKAGTTIAPKDITAKSDIAHSGRFSEAIKTLSPFLTPYDCKTLVNFLTCTAASLQVTPSQKPSFFDQNNGLSFREFACSKKIPGNVFAEIFPIFYSILNLQDCNNKN